MASAQWAQLRNASVIIVNLDFFDQLGGQGVKVGVQAKMPNLVFNMPVSSVSSVSSF